MTRTTQYILATAVPAFLLLAAIALAASGDDYDLTWHTIDGGGGTSAGSSFVLSGTIGQPDAGSMSGGSFTLVGGFWAGAAPGDGDPKTPCHGDLTGSGSVGVADLLALLACWGTVEPGGNCAHADLTASGSVGVADLLSLLAAWGPCP